ncbi:MAG: hypothetical protein WD603_02010 [Patescibacteria group bacterium]
MLKYIAAGAISVALWIIVLAPAIDDEPANDQRTAAPLLDGVQPAQPAKRKMACKLVIHTGRPVAASHQISRDCTSVEVVTLASRRNRMTLREMGNCTTSMTAGTRDVPVPTLPLFNNEHHPGENQPPRCSRKTAVLYNPR